MSNDTWPQKFSSWTLKNVRNIEGEEPRVVRKKLFSLEVDVNSEGVVQLQSPFSLSTSFFIQNLFILNCSQKPHIVKGG